MKKLTTLTLSTLLFSALISPTSALIVEDCNNEEFLINSSEYIIEGEVLGVTSSWNEEETNIYTENTIKIIDVLKGDLEENSIIITTSGGQVGEITQTTTPEARFKEGSLVRVFLSKIGQDFMVVCAHAGLKILSETGDLSKLTEEKALKNDTEKDKNENDLKDIKKDTKDALTAGDYKKLNYTIIIAIIIAILSLITYYKITNLRK